MKVKKTRVIAAFIVLIALAVGLWRDATEKVESATESRDAVSEKESIEEAREIASTNTAPEAEIGSSEEKADAIEPSAATNAVKISYKKVDKSIPRLRQAATANRLYIAPESGRLVEEKFAATQEPSARGTVPYVLIPTSEIDDIHHERLASMGVRELGYFPPNGMLVELTEDQFNAIAKDEMFSLVGEWSASDKIEPHIARQFDREELTLTVTTCNPVDVSSVAEKILSFGGKIISQGDSRNGWLWAKMPVESEKLVALAADGGVHWIQPYEQPKLLNNYAARPDHLNVSPYWSAPYGLTGAGQIVAIADSGLDTGDKNTVFEDFQGRVLDILNVGIANLFDSTLTPTGADYGGHGTHVAGSVFGNGAKSSGTYKGMAYEASGLILGLGTTSATDTSVYPPADVFTKEIGTYNYRIHSNSWGDANDGSYGYYSEYADEATVSYPGLVITVAAGNSGHTSTPMVSPPGTAKNVITVGSCDNTRDAGATFYTNYGNFTHSGDVDSRSYFSSYGTEDEGRYKPDLVAVGCRVVSTRTTMNSNTSTLPWYNYNTKYTVMQGTSMATPIAAGCATLVRQWLVEQKGYSTTEPSSALIKAILTGGTSASRPTMEQGWGRINLGESLYPTNRSVYLYDRISNTSDNSKLIGTFTVTRSDLPLRVQLAWIDAVKTYGASGDLVKDHNLIVSNVTTRVGYIGNDFDNAGTYDTVNNVEGVRIATPDLGEYKVYMTGRTTEYGKQTVPAIYVSVADGAIAEETVYHANITSSTVSWSDKSGLSDIGGAELTSSGSDAIQLTNTVASTTIDLGSGFTAGSLSLYGSGIVELACSDSPSVGTLTVGIGLTALNLRDNLWSGATFNLPDSLILRYCGTTAMASLPYAAAATPCIVAIARPYTNADERLAFGNGSNAVQDFYIEDGATITAKRITTGAGQYATTRITQTGGTVIATGSGDSTGESGNAILLGHRRSTASYNLQGGMLSAPNGMLRFGWDGTVTASVGGGSSAATMSAKSMLLGYANSDYGRTVEVRVLENGVLDVGSGGITTAKSTAVLYLAGGTLKLADGATADMTTSALTVSSASTIQSDGEATITGSVTGSGSIHIAAGTIAFPGILSSNPMTIADGAKVKIPLTSGQAALENVLLFSTTQTQEQLDGKIILVDSTTGDELDNTFVVSNGMVLLRNAVVEPLSGTVYLNGADYVAKMTANGYSEWLYSKAYEGDRHYIVTNLTEGYYAHIEKVPSKGIRLVLVKDKPEALWAGDFSSARQDFGDWKMLPNGNTVANGKISIIDSSHGGVVVSNVVGTIDHAMGLSVAATFTGVASNTGTNQTLIAFRQQAVGKNAAAQNEITGTHIVTDGTIKGIWEGKPWGSTPTGSAYPTDGGTHGYVSTYSKSGTYGFLDGTSGFSADNLKATNADSSKNRLVSATIGGRHEYSSCNMTNVTVDALAVFTNVTFDAASAGAWRSYSVTVSNITDGAALEGVYDVLKLTGGEVTINGTVCARAIDITGNVTLKGTTNSCLRASAIYIASGVTVTAAYTFDASEETTVTVMDGTIANGGSVTPSVTGGTASISETSSKISLTFTPKTTTTLNIGASDGESTIEVSAATVTELAAAGSVDASDLDNIASNGLRVWQNVMLGLTPAEETVEKITLAIVMQNGSPVVETSTGNLNGLSLDNPTKAVTIEGLTATATLQQAGSPNAETWSTADKTSATNRFYRIVVTFKTN